MREWIERGVRGSMEGQGGRAILGCEREGERRQAKVGPRFAGRYGQQ